MNKQILDKVLSKMLSSFEADVSDLNCTPFRPLQVEAEGKLSEVKLETPLEKGYLSPYQTAMLTLQIIGNDKVIMHDIIKTGSCDLSYQLGDIARFRVNIFSGKKNYTIL